MRAKRIDRILLYYIEQKENDIENQHGRSILQSRAVKNAQSLRGDLNGRSRRCNIRYTRVRGSTSQPKKTR